MTFPHWNLRALAAFGVLGAMLCAVFVIFDPIISFATEQTGKEEEGKVDVVTWIIRIIGATTVVYYANAAFIHAEWLIPFMPVTRYVDG